jgi:hypothetical protein
MGNGFGRGDHVNLHGASDRRATGQKTGLSWPNTLIRSLSGQSPEEVIATEWLIVERMCYSARTGNYLSTQSAATLHRAKSDQLGALRRGQCARQSTVQSAQYQNPSVDMILMTSRHPSQPTLSNPAIG